MRKKGKIEISIKPAFLFYFSTGGNELQYIISVYIIENSYLKQKRSVFNKCVVFETTLSSLSKFGHFCSKRLGRALFKSFRICSP